METKTVNIRLNDILHRRQLSSTESRRKILTLFLNSDDALTHGDIEKEVGSKYDRVTIYRTLQTFEEKGIIHSLPGSDIHSSFIRLNFTGKDLEKSGFTGPVGADNAITVSFSERNIHLIKKHPLSE